MPVRQQTSATRSASKLDTHTRKPHHARIDFGWRNRGTRLSGAGSGEQLTPGSDGSQRNRVTQPDSPAPARQPQQQAYTSRSPHRRLGRQHRRHGAGSGRTSWASRYRSIDTGQLRGKNPLTAAKNAGKMLSGIRQSRGLLSELQAGCLSCDRRLRLRSGRRCVSPARRTCSDLSAGYGARFCHPLVEPAGPARGRQLSGCRRYFGGAVRSKAARPSSPAIRCARNWSSGGTGPRRAQTTLGGSLMDRRSSLMAPRPRSDRWRTRPYRCCSSGAEVRVLAASIWRHGTLYRTYYGIRTSYIL